MTRLLGREDCDVATAHEADLLRILTPITKLYTAKQVNRIYIKFIYVIQVISVLPHYFLKLSFSGREMYVRGSGEFWGIWISGGHRFTKNAKRCSGNPLLDNWWILIQ